VICLRFILGFATACLLLLSARSASAASPPRITITAPAEGDWTIEYQFDRPTTELHFARSPDASRAVDWIAPQPFLIAKDGEDEVIRRRDGASFAAVRIAVPPLYRVLPSDYAPFSPFSDGGLLFHSGRFFACPSKCAANASWSMRLIAPPEKDILLDGVRRHGIAAWGDSGEGRNVYVGRATPVETPDLVAIFDAGLPADIRNRLAAHLPAFMRYFAAHLGKLPGRPMLFASYDPAYKGGYGRQGGTLQGQVFTHFYGSKWPELMRKPDFPDELLWFFAHEAGHLYQRQIFTAGNEGAWIHEGGAEASAAIAMRALYPAAAPYVARRIEQARGDCERHRGGRSLHAALRADAYDAAYSCGLLINLEIDASIRKADPSGDGLFAAWRDYIKRAGKGGEGQEDMFLASVAAIGGRDLAARIARQLDDSRPDLGGL